MDDVDWKNTMLTIQTAIDAFLEGWIYSRRMERAITLTPLESMRVVQFGDAPMLKPRPDEFMIYDTPPQDAVALVREVYPALSHHLSVFTNNMPETLAAYAHYGYHLYQHEYLMAMEVDAARLSPSPEISVRRVTTDEERRWFNAANGREVIPPRALHDPHIVYYYVRFDDDLACEGRSVLTTNYIAVADSIYTAEDYRRHGLGAALMQTALLDATNSGASHAVLVASDDGRKLYLTLGYMVLSDLLILEPD
jgi:GNAT superfamily N-acetyltransferase